MSICAKFHAFITKCTIVAPIGFATNESKEIIKKYEEIWSKIRDLIRSITKNSDDYHEKCMKIKFDSDDGLPLNKTIGIYNVTIAVRAIFMKIKHIIHKFL